jgi:hypothetical protein
MEFEGPTGDDLENIRALNRVYLELLNNAGEFARYDSRRLSTGQIDCLAAAPFLLCSFREHDSACWDQLLGEDPQLPLQPVPSPASAALREVQIAGLGFLWQLARRNPYAARMNSGAPLSWCERMASVTLVHLLERTAARGDLMSLRLGDRPHIWRRLLNGSNSRAHDLRAAARCSALHALLTDRRSARYAPLAAAACKMPAPAQRVAEHRTGVVAKKV